MNKEAIGFVGVGLMGHGMATNLLKAGFPLTVIAHRNRTPIEDLIAQGATEATNLADLAAASSVVHICAPGSPQVEAIVDALMPSMQPGSVVVDCSTSDPTSTMALAKKLEASGFFMADAPLGGTPVQAQSGELATMVGADAAVYERLTPI